MYLCEFYCEFNSNIFYVMFRKIFNIQVYTVFKIINNEDINLDKVEKKKGYLL
jgi:hypothetical protein